MIEIVRSLRRGDETASAALYWRAFGRKLGWPLGPEQRGIEFLATHLRHDRAICAYIDDELIGLAGYKHQKRALTGGQACDWPAHNSPADHPRAGESYPVDPKTCRLNFLFPSRIVRSSRSRMWIAINFVTSFLPTVFVEDRDQD